MGLCYFLYNFILLGLASAQFPPQPTGLTTIESNILPGVNITYKEVPANICNASAKTYAGYINFPANSMPDAAQGFPIHSFFWYVESQLGAESAPLTVWMNGGPGAGSVFGVLVENGPCRILEDSQTQMATNESWNKYSNLLYIDQPVQAGFSYDEITEGLLDVTSGNVVAYNSNNTNPLLVPGMFSSQNASSTANTTANAARHFWHFAQIWTREFDIYRNTSANDRINIWTESYGGRYGPGFAGYILEQNDKIKNQTLNATTLHLDTLGVINGCIDLLTQEQYYPEYAYDLNQYGLEAINKAQYDAARSAWNKTSMGCQEQIEHCHTLSAERDPGVYGNDSAVNGACQNASNFCLRELEGPYLWTSQRGQYDISHCVIDPFPPNSYLGYLAKSEVQQALGVPVNWTDISGAVGQAFNNSGDYAREDMNGYINDLGALLDSGVKVALVYGDRDFACNWVGGEQASLAVNYTSSENFKQAGYTNITGTDDLANPWGQVRQHGNFSFSRVYQSGHMVPAYQPAVALEIFRRTLSNMDVATGGVPVTNNYTTSGTKTSYHPEKLPQNPSPTCYLLTMGATCAENQMQAVYGKTAKVFDYIITDPPPSNGSCPL
ncbi:alpha/beta-hydrolase [Aspergillus californicus]